MPKAKEKRKHLNPDAVEALGRRSNWKALRRQRQIEKLLQPSQSGCNHEGQCECIQEEECIVPSAFSRLVRRMRGPTVSDAMDGLTYQETREIDLSKVAIESRWKPYLATGTDGKQKVLFRLRPKHWGQRSGGKVFPEEIERENATPGNSFSFIVQCDMYENVTIFRPFNKCKVRERKAHCQSFCQ